MVTSGTGHDRCPSQVAGPLLHADRLMATPKKFVNPNKVSRGPRKFFSARNLGWLTHSCAEPLSFAPAARPPSAASLPCPNSSPRPPASSRSPRFRHAARPHIECAVPRPCPELSAPCRRPAACVRVSSAWLLLPWLPRAHAAAGAGRTLEQPFDPPLRRLAQEIFSPCGLVASGGGSFLRSAR